MIPSHTEKLENGLTVLVQEMRSAPVVAVQTWVGVGSADESPAEAGLAHLHEHMLFKGTERRKVGEIAQAIEGAGGEINAWTSFDQTVYHVVLASRFFQVGLDVLADAVQNSAFDPAELAREKEVVLEEIKRGEDQPSRTVTQELFRLAYQKHPYRNPVIGTRERVASFTRDDVTAFFKKWYVPDNVTLVIVGDVSAKHAIEEARRAFGGFRRSPVPKRHGLAESGQKRPRASVLRAPFEEAHFNFAVHIPAIAHKDVPALDLLASVLGQGESTRLLQNVKRQKGLVNDIYAYAYTPVAPGLLTVGATCAPGKTREALKQSLFETFRLTREEVLDDELAKARAVIESQSIFDRETAQGMARKLGFYQSVFGDLTFEQRYYDAIAKTTPRDLLDVAQRYLRADAVTSVVVLPEKSRAGASLDKAACLALVAAEAKPRPARPRRETSEVQRIELPSGGTMLVRRDARVPLVAVRAVWAGGLRFETPRTNGVTNFLSEMLTQGTRHRSTDELAHEMDAMAGSLGGVMGRNSFGLRAELLAKHFDRGLELFVECLCEPGFHEADIERQRGLLLEEIRVQSDNPSGVAFRAFSKALYPKHPYRLHSLGEPEVVKRLHSGDFSRFYAKNYAPGRAVYSIVGDIDPDRAAERLTRLLGAAPAAGPAPSAPLADPPLRRPVAVETVLEKKQAHVVIGFRGATLRDKDRYALEVLSTILSGQGGRLFYELRDKRSLAYSVASFAVEGLEPGYFAVYMGTSPEKTTDAVKGIFEELGKTQESPVSVAELRRAQRYLVGANAISLQRLSARAATLSYDEVYGVGHNDSEKYPERVLAVTRDEILDVARRYLDPRHVAMSIVRPASAPGLASIDLAALTRGRE